MNAAGSPSPDTRPRKRRRSILWRSRRVFYTLAVLGIVAFGGVWIVLNTIELPAERRPIETSFVCDLTVADGQCTVDSAMASITSSEQRVLVDYEELPPVLVQAVLSAEDRNFFDHSGIDPLGISRAFVQDVVGDSESRQGGSTITQQYVKAVYLSRDRTLERKLKEAVMAVKLEKELDKREILTRYLNEVYFGRGAYGVEAASRAYFGVSVGDLQLYQAAYLAGLIRSPESADATRDPEEATRRRNITLDAMVEEGYVAQSQAEEAKAIPWISEPTAADGTPQIVTVLARRTKDSDFGDIRHRELGSEYWLEWVRSQLRERFGPGAETRGLRIYTTFDPALQAVALESVTGVLDGPEAPLGSLVAVDRAGRVRAMVAGTDFSTSKVNLALGKEGGGSGRPAGSTFKPFALAAFVEDGYSVKSRFEAPPTTSFPGVYSGPDRLWKPANYDFSDHGVQTVQEATWSSTNTVYAGIVDTVTPEALAEMATRLGVRSELQPNYSLVLGTGEVSVLDMASAYSTISRDGVRIDPYVIRRVEDADGNVLFDAATEMLGEQVVTEEVAQTVASVLQGVITKGTGKSAGLQVPAAGKTGTTNDSKDAWFAGFTCDMTAAVWMGYEQPEKMVYKGRSVSGGSFPAQIWRTFMREATADTEGCEFPKVDAGEEILNSNKVPSSQATTVPSSSSTSSTSTTTPGGSTTSSASTTTAPTTTVAPTTSSPAPPAPAAPPA
jgi:penicillin-binding protein 1A